MLRFLHGILILYLTRYSYRLNNEKEYRCVPKQLSLLLDIHSCLNCLGTQLSDSQVRANIGRNSILNSMRRFLAVSSCAMSVKRVARRFEEKASTRPSLRYNEAQLLWCPFGYAICDL